MPSDWHLLICAENHPVKEAHGALQKRARIITASTGPPASPAMSVSGFEAKRGKKVLGKENNPIATKISYISSVWQLRLHTCFSLYRQAPRFLVCFAIFPITLRTPGSYSNICSQIRSFIFIAHMLQLTLLRDPNTTTPKETHLHVTFQSHLFRY